MNFFRCIGCQITVYAFHFQITSLSSFVCTYFQPYQKVPTFKELYERARWFILHPVPSDSLYRQIKSAQSTSVSLWTLDAKCSFAIHAVTELITSSSTPYNTSQKRSHLVNFDNIKFTICECSLRLIDTISDCYNLLKNRLRVLEASVVQNISTK